MTSVADQVAASLQVEADLFGVVVQAVSAGSEFYIYLNRPPETAPDCPELVALIKDKLTKEFPEITSIYLLSRILGEEHPDWQEHISLLPEPVPSLSTEEIKIDLDLNFENLDLDIAESVEPVVTSAPEVKLNSFCFSRNRQLVEGDIDRPSKTVSEILRSFHGWSHSNKVELLSFLKEWFADPSAVAPDRLPEPAQAIIAQMSADKELQRSLKVWFSRYCFDPEKTLREISGEVHSQPHKVKVSGHSTASSSSTTAPRKVQASMAYPSKSSAKKPASTTKTSQAFTSDEIPMLIVTAIVVAVCSFFLRGIISAFEPVGVGIFLAVVAIAGGWAGAFQEKMIGSICGFILIVFYVLFGFFNFVILIIDGLGGAIGFSVGMAVKMGMGENNSIFAPKPLRVMAVALIVLLTIQAPALFQIGRGGQNTVQLQILPELKATGSVTYGGQTYNLKGAIAEWDKEDNILTIGAVTRELNSQDLENARNSVADAVSKILDQIDSNTVALLVDIKFAQQKPVAYRLGISNKNINQLTKSYSIRTQFLVSPNTKGLKISNLQTQNDGRVNLSLSHQETIRANVTFDTKVVAIRN